MAKNAFKTCLTYSVKYQFFDEYSRACEVWLSKNYGAEFHLIDEFRGAPTRVNSGLSDRAVPLNLDGTPYVVEDAAAAAEKAAPSKAVAAPDGDAKPEEKPGVSKEQSALDKATPKKK